MLSDFSLHAFLLITLVYNPYAYLERDFFNYVALNFQLICLESEYDREKIDRARFRG